MKAKLMATFRLFALICLMAGLTVIVLDSARAETPHLCRSIFSPTVDRHWQVATGMLDSAAQAHHRSEFAIHRYVYSEFVAKNEILFPADREMLTDVMQGVGSETGLHPYFDYNTLLRFAELTPDRKNKIAEAYLSELLLAQTIQVKRLRESSSQKSQLRATELEAKLNRLKSLARESESGRRAVLDVITTHFPYYFTAWSHHAGVTFTKANDPVYIPLMATIYLGSAWAFESTTAGVPLAAIGLGAYAIGKLAFGKLGVKWRAHRLVHSVKRIFANSHKEEQAETNWSEWMDEKKRLSDETNKALKIAHRSPTRAVPDILASASYRLLNAASIAEALRVIDLDNVKLLKQTYAVSGTLGRKAKEDIGLQLEVINERLNSVAQEVLSVKAAVATALEIREAFAMDESGNNMQVVLQSQLQAADQVLMQIDLAKILSEELALANDLYDPTAGKK